MSDSKVMEILLNHIPPRGPTLQEMINKQHPPKKINEVTYSYTLPLKLRLKVKKAVKKGTRVYDLTRGEDDDDEDDIVPPTPQPVVPMDEPTDCFFDSYAQQMWNKSYQCVMRSDFYQNNIKDVVKAKFTAVFANPEVRVHMQDFLEAGDLHTDFIQICAFDTHFHFGKCFCCGRTDELLCRRIKMTQHTPASRRSHRKGTTKQLYRSMHLNCFHRMMSVIEIYNHLWCVSLPLAGYSYQGFSAFSIPKYKYGSTAEADITQAYNEMQYLIEREVDEKSDYILYEKLKGSKH